MYCINCGVKLADSEKECPLCHTRVFHPDLMRPEGEPLYPNKAPAVKKRSLFPQIFATVAFVMTILIVFLCDWQLNHTVSWSGYVMGALLLAYVMLVLPFWFRRPNPVIFVPCDFVAIGLYLLYIDLFTHGHWFLSFAFPVVGGIGLIVTAVVTLLRYVHGGKLYIFGGASILLGAFMLLLEFLLDLTFDISGFIGWSLYPLTVLVTIGGMLLYLAIWRPAREAIERKFFI